MNLEQHLYEHQLIYILAHPDTEDECELIQYFTNTHMGPEIQYELRVKNHETDEYVTIKTGEFINNWTYKRLSILDYDVQFIHVGQAIKNYSE